jgi:hypothetical protein
LAKHLAILRRPDEKACLTTKTKPKNLAGTIRLLKRMAADKIIKNKYYSPTRPELYFLPGTKALDEYKIKHEKLCADLYVAYELSGQIENWECPTDYEENISLGLKPDRRFTINGKVCFLEVDRGTEDYHTPKGIRGKLDKYIQLSRRYPSKRFHVIFTTIDAKQTAKTRSAALLEMFAESKRGDMFLTTLHRWAVNEPLEPIYMSGENPMGIAL